MAALLRIVMLVERGAVEAAEPVRIVGEMPGHPVQDDGEPGAVAGIDQGGEIGRGAEAAGRREQAGRLIAPGAVERMLADRQEFDVGEAHVAHIGRQLLRQLAVGEPAAALVAAAGATSRDALRRSRSARRSALTPAGARLRPRDRVEIDDDRGGLRPQLGRECRADRTSAAAGGRPAR